VSSLSHRFAKRAEQEPRGLIIRAGHPMTLMHDGDPLDQVPFVVIVGSALTRRAVGLHSGRA